MLRTLLAFLMFLAVTAWPQQQQGTVDVTAEPHHHHVLDNMFVRAYAVTVDPKTTSLMHRHSNNYLSVSLGDAEILNTKEGAQPVTTKLKDGDVRYTAAPLVHAVTDAADTPFRNITIELMQPTINQKACTEACEIPVTCEKNVPCASVTKVMTADQWSVTRITIPPGGFYPKHTHLANFLVIPLTDGDTKVQAQDAAPITNHADTGKITWNNPVIHSITNTGSKPVSVVVLEFRGRPSGEGSESMGPQDTKPGEHKPHDHH
jgi:quercetin dioxygenase-like cupin family protein